MKLMRETGYTEVVMLGAENSYRFPLRSYSKLRDAWLNGNAFIETETWYGSMMTIKLSRVETIAEWTDAAVDVCVEERRLQAIQDSYRGE